MAEGDRLGALKMGETRHHGCRMRLGLGQKRPHQGGQLLVRPVMGVADPETDIDRDLVVAAARRVKPGRRLPDDLPQSAFDIHVNVFERRRKGERPALDLAENPLKAGVDRGPVVLRDDALLRQHGAVGERALDVLGGEALVEADGGVDGFHERARRSTRIVHPTWYSQTASRFCPTLCFTRWICWACLCHT